MTFSCFQNVYHVYISQWGEINLQKSLKIYEKQSSTSKDWWVIEM